MKDRVLLEHDVLPADRARQIGAFGEDYNTPHDHGSLGNLTPAGV